LATNRPFYATRQPRALLGLNEFKAHDGAATWHDGGLAKSLVLEPMAKAISDYAGNQVRDAVVEYLGTGRFALTLIDNDVYVAFEVSNPQVRLCPVVKLADLLADALRDSERDPNFRTSLAAALNYGQQPAPALGRGMAPMNGSMIPPNGRGVR
jgi:hypothetical protein